MSTENGIVRIEDVTVDAERVPVSYMRKWLAQPPRPMPVARWMLTEEQKRALPPEVPELRPHQRRVELHLKDGICVRSEWPVAWMKGKTAAEVRHELKRRGWTATILRPLPRDPCTGLPAS